MLKVWGRNTSSNVQKVMWATAELGIAVERIDVGGPFGKNKEAAYLAMNPNGLVPTLEEDDGWLLWESNSIVRYLAARHDKSGLLEPKDLRERARASQWMDWQLSVAGPAIFGLFWGMVRTPAEKRDMAAIEESKKKTGAALAMLETQLAKTTFVAGANFSYGDIPIAIVAYRYIKLAPDRPAMPNLDRWFAAISSRPGFKDHVSSIPLV